MQLLEIGFGSFVSAEKLVAVFSPDSAPIRRMIADARERGLLIDASFGRSTRSVLLMNSNHIILSSLGTGELSGEAAGAQASDGDKGGGALWRNAGA